MKKGILTALVLVMSVLAIPAAAQSDSVSVDSVKADTHRPSFFKRAYKFMDGVLSPKRDTSYIDVQDYYNWCGMLQLSGRFDKYRIDAGNEMTLDLSPRFSTRLGPFFGWRFLFSGYNFDLKYLIPKSSDIDLTASIYSAAFGFDLFYRRVGSDYKINKLVYKSIDYSDVLQGQGFDGVSVGMTRVSFYYVKNYKRYSHQAAFNQTHRQKRSAGSLVIGASYAHNHVSLDEKRFSDLINRLQNDTHKNDPVFSKLGNDEFSFTLGYGYNYAFAKNWLAAGEIQGSIGYLLQRYNGNTLSPDFNYSDDGKISNDGGIIGFDKFFKSMNDFRRKNLALNGTTRFSLLYNCGPWFAGTQSVIFYYQHGNAQAQTRNILGCIYLFVGCNF